ncbi:MAG: 16S rRNA (uracil(1498)-N(3))-methyltransferase [Syntrophobacterales bacterium]|nr:16S rRNA (uracil(1498)-N(3))-methyltransferase [Syntrophobacterales bacterium]
MTTPRLYLPPPLPEGEIISLNTEHRHYLKNVLRLRGGAELILFDGAGWEYAARVEVLDAREGTVRIVGRIKTVPTPTTRITLAQALPKGAKMDGIVEKATELGVGRIIPFVSERSVPSWTAAKTAERIRRWEKIAVEAARRCRRPDIPEIAPVSSYGDMLASASTPGGGSVGVKTSSGEEAPTVKIIFWEEKGGRDIKDLLRGQKGPPPPGFFLVVGPEGGLAADEVAQARAAGFVVASLGRQVFRVETAALVIITIIQYELGTFAAAD